MLRPHLFNVDVRNAAGTRTIPEDRVVLSNARRFLSILIVFFITSSAGLKLSFASDIDGSDPTTSGNVYRTPLLITADTRLKYSAVDEDGTGEKGREGLYRFRLAEQMVDTTPPEAFAVPPPEKYRAGDLIRLTASEEAQIYYTLDGSDPDGNSEKYDSPFWLTTGSELKFLAVDGSGNKSRIYSETYQLDREAPVSEAFPETGVYASPLKVRITVSEADAKVFYTLDGSVPGTDSPSYAEPLVLTKDTVLKFFSVDPLGNRETVREETYLFDDDPPVTIAEPPGGSYTPPVHVTLRTEKAAVTHYSLDGYDPDLNSPIYFSGFVFNRPTTLKFFSVDSAGNREKVQTNEYTLVNGVWQKYARGVYLVPSVTDGRTFWMGSESGLAVYDVGSGDRSFIGEAQGLQGTVINDLMLDEDGTLWVATDLGLSSYKKEVGFTYFSQDEGLPDREVLCLGVDRDNSVWAGTRKGVSRISGGIVKETLTVADGLPDNTVLSVAVDFNGNRWFGTLDGLAKYTGTEWSIFNRENGLINNEIRTVAVDAAWNIWVGTPRGVSVFEGEFWESFTSKDGLPGNAVVLIAPDPDGQVWVATRTGVARYVSGEWKKENPP